MGFGYDDWAPYVPVAERRAKAAKEMQKLKKNGHKIEPIEIQGRTIAHTFWGLAWCDHLEQFSDYRNRLPRGRTYVRNGSVCHLAITKGTATAIVSGSKLYKVNVNIASLSAYKWTNLRKQCAGQIGSILELLQGGLSENVMRIVTDRKNGLFPNPGEMQFACNCPDGAGMCKHIAAAIYGIGARLDQQPQLLFLLRNVDHNELITTELDIKSTGKSKGRRLAQTDLSSIFGVEMDESIKTADRQKTTPNIPIRKEVTVKKTTTKKQMDFNPTAVTVARLRKHFKMTVPQFAKLLGISSLTIKNWETASGKLNLRQHTYKALLNAAKLTPKQAMINLKRK